ncbi:MAG: flagellar motor switch protein FliN [Deltaproteobacteria bacterium]|nr:flagellar motor switch protein FliN [Deltaproteobacteria bacterium]
MQDRIGESSETEKDPKQELARDIDFLLDIPVKVIVELGKTKVQLGELLRLGRGSVLELSKAAEEPLDVHVNGKLIGRGEVVVVNNKFGIKLTEIAPTDERVEMLK